MTPWWLYVTLDGKEIQIGETTHKKVISEPHLWVKGSPQWLPQTAQLVAQFLAATQRPKQPPPPPRHRLLYDFDGGKYGDGWLRGYRSGTREPEFCYPPLWVEEIP